MKKAGVVLDAGLFIAVERRDRVAVQRVELFRRNETPLVTSAGVVAQVWRVLRLTEVVDLSHSVAKVLGNMLGLTRTSDPIDAHVALLARQRGWPVLTSDPDDLLAIDPTLRLQRI